MNICISERSSAPSARLPKWSATPPALISCAVALLMAVLPVVLQGQASGPTRESWTVGLAAGVFNYEPSQDQGFPIITVRADRPTSKWGAPRGSHVLHAPRGSNRLRYAIRSVTARRTHESFHRHVGRSAPIDRGSVGALWGYFGRIFGRYDGDSAGRRFGRSTFQFPFGIRIWATDHIGVRGEYRFDEDRHEAGSTHSDSEMTAGVFWTF